MANSQSTTSGTPADLEMRVAQFAARTIAVCEALPKRVGSDHLRDQLFRSSTSVAANYAEACVPESRKDFAHKINIALKELVESRMWLRIIAMKQYVEPRTLQKLLAETDELVKIFHASVKTARKNLALSEE
jgi:four helix bundle protein